MKLNSKHLFELTTPEMVSGKLPPGKLPPGKFPPINLPPENSHPKNSHLEYSRPCFETFPPEFLNFLFFHFCHRHH